MAIYNGRILMRKGNEADFDASKLMSGEWAVSLDAGIVRICLEAGKVIRMATYEAFEEDMKQIEAILLECQSIEEAVRRINTEVSEKLNACAEYVQQAKGYSEQAKTSEANAKSYMQSAKTSEENAKVSEKNAKASENSAKEYENSAKLTEERAREVFESIPEDYSTISNDLYELAIKETASGEEIYVNDSSNLKLREFALYGKARQNTTSGNQLLPTTIEELSVGGIVTKNNGDGSFSIIGTAQFAYGIYIIGNSFVGLNPVFSLSKGTYYVSGLPESSELFFYKVGETASSIKTKNGVFVLEEDLECISVSLRWIENATFNSPITKIMLNKGTTALPWEEFSSGMASPNPQYPQPIEVSGASGSVAVKSCGSQLINPYNSIEATISSGVVQVAPNSKLSYIRVNKGETYTLSKIKSDSYVYTGFCDVIPKVGMTLSNRSNVTDLTKSTFTATDNYFCIIFQDKNDKTIDSIMLNEGSTALSYEPYKETLATIPTENCLAGIKVSENGNYTDQNGQQWICDEVVKYADGSGALIQRIGKAVFDGSEDEAWQDRTESYTNKDDGQYRYVTAEPINYKKVTTKINYMSNYGASKPIAGTAIRSDDGVSTYSNTDREQRYLYLTAKNIPSLQDLKTKLAEEPLVFLVELATPIHTPLTAEELAEIEKLSTFYPVTNISNDADCGMKVTYLADSKLYIDNRLAQIEQALVNNI